MKKKLFKYRSVLVICGSMIFNLVSSLLVYRPEGVIFNKTPLTVEEYICNIISAACFFVGILMAMFDSNNDSKEKIEEAFRNGADELRKVNIGFEEE